MKSTEKWNYPMHITFTFLHRTHTHMPTPRPTEIYLFLNVIDRMTVNLKCLCIFLQRIRNYHKNHNVVHPFKKFNLATALFFHIKNILRFISKFPQLSPNCLCSYPSLSPIKLFHLLIIFLQLFFKSSDIH